MADDIFGRDKRESINDISSFKNTGGFAVDQLAKVFGVEVIKDLALAVGADVKDVLKGLEDLFNALNEILVQANTLGVNPDRLQRLTRAGRVAGVTDDVTLGGLTNLARVLQKERVGGKSVETILDKLDIEIKQPNGRPKDLIQIFRDVSDKFAVPQDPTKRLDLAAQAFGQDNVTLVQLAKLGSKKIGELGANVTTFSKELLQAAAEFRKNGLIVNEDKLFRLIELELQKFGVVAKARESINLGPSRASKPPIKSVPLGIRDGKAVEIKPGESPLESQGSGGAPGDAVLGPARLTPEAVGVSRGLEATFAGLSEAFRSGLAEPLEKIAKCCEELPLLLGPKAIAAPAPPPLLPAREEFKTLKESLHGGPDAGSARSDGAAAAVASLEAALGGVESKAGAAGQVLLHLFDNLSRRAGDFTSELAGVTDALAGIGGKAGDVFGILSRLFGGGGSLEGLLGSLGGLFGFASGGSVQPGFPAIVGERGPELFIPAAPGRIVNNAGVRGMAAARTINIVQHMTFTTDVRNSVRAEILNTAPAIVEASKRAVAEAVTRGGGGTLFR